MALGQLGDVHEALDAVVDADERTERDELGDLAGDDLTDRVGAGEVLPRVLLRRLQRQGDTLAVHVDVEHLDGDLLAPTSTTSDGWSMCFHDSSETWTRPSTPPRSTNAPKLTIEDTTPERTWPFWSFLRNVVRTSDCVCSSQARRDRTTLLRFLSSSMILASISLPTYGWRSRTRRISTSEAGQEAAQADVEDETTLDDLDDGAGDDAVLFLDLLDRAPGALVLRTLLGQDQATFLVLLLEDEGLDLVADLDDLGGVDVVLDGQLARGDDALGLVADVEQDLVPVDLDDDTLDDVAVVEVLDGRVDRGKEVFLRADVVDGNLRRGLLDRAGSHVVGTPIVDS